jgi:hypothetical protein
MKTVQALTILTRSGFVEGKGEVIKMGNFNIANLKLAHYGAVAEALAKCLKSEKARAVIRAYDCGI